MNYLTENLNNFFSICNLCDLYDKKSSKLIGQKISLLYTTLNNPIRLLLQEDSWFSSGDLKPTTITKSRRPPDTSSTTSEDRDGKKKARKSLSPEETLRRRLMTLYKTVFDFQVSSLSSGEERVQLYMKLLMYHSSRCDDAALSIVN